jgi:hypothetical protein
LHQINLSKGFIALVPGNIVCLFVEDDNFIDVEKNFEKADHEKWEN